MFIVIPVNAAIITIDNITFNINDDQKAFQRDSITGNVVLDSLPNGFKNASITYELNDESIATFTGFSAPTWATTTKTWHDANTVTVNLSDDGDAITNGATDVNIGVIVVDWVDSGVATITSVVIELFDDNGNAIVITLYNDCGITVNFIGNSEVDYWVPTYDTEYVTNYTYDVDTGTYTQMWLPEFINTGEFNIFNFGASLMSPIMLVFGYFIFVIFWVIYLFIVWVRSGNIVMPLIVGMLTGGMWGLTFPAEVQYLGNVLLGICITVILVKLLLDKI